MLLANILSDDQFAIVGCFAALAVCGLIAMISFHFGPAGQKKTSGPASLRMNSTQSKQTAAEVQERRAA
jgi:hypothetical protein